MELQEACTTQALLNNIKDIFSLVEFCSAKESGQMSASAAVGGLKSACQAGKFRHQSDHPPHATTNPTTHTWSKCGKKGHSSQCKSKPKVAADEAEKESTDGAVAATNGAISFGFYAIHAILTLNRFEELSNLPLETTQTVASISPGHRQTISITSHTSAGTSSSPSRRNTKWSRRGLRKASNPKPMPGVPTHLMETLTSGSMMAGMSSTIPLCHIGHPAPLKIHAQITHNAKVD